MKTRRFVFWLFWMAFLSFALFSCDKLKGFEIKLTANPTEIPAGGYEYAEIQAVLKKSNKPYKNGTIQFETTGGSFSNVEDVTQTDVATDENGIATVRLYSARIQGAAVVKATYYNDQTGENAEATVNVTFGPPSNSSLPLAGNFQLNCDYVNVGGFVSPKPDVRINCQVSARNRNGASIPPESLPLTFVAEAGDLSSETDSWGVFKVVYKVRGGDPAPVDVAPLSGEPSRACGGLTCNPRDGLVTLMAVTRGAERFTDRNSNNQYDDGEPFDDLPEPFLDVNDNGLRDNEEWFYDANGDGEWNDANGRYDEDTMISAYFKLVWTGIPEENETAAWITYSPNDTSLPQAGSLTVRVKLVDKNLNPVAGFSEASSQLNFREYYYALAPTQPSSNPGSFSVSNFNAIEMDANWRFLSYNENATEFSCVFVDTNPQSTESSPWRLSLDATLCAGPQGDNAQFTTYEYAFERQINGNIQ